MRRDCLRGHPWELTCSRLFRARRERPGSAAYMLPQWANGQRLSFFVYRMSRP